MTLCHKWCDLPSVSNGNRGCVEKDCCSSHCLQGRNLSPRGGDGAITWHISTNPHEIHVHTGKLTCPLWKTYISIGNSSSNQWFSGDMLVSREFSNYFLTTHPPQKKTMMDTAFGTCWHADIASVENGPFFPKALTRTGGASLLLPGKIVGNPGIPNPKGASWCNETPMVFRGLPMHPTTETRWILISVAGGFFSLGQSFIVNIVN